MLSDQALTAWLVVYSYATTEGRSLHVPDCVTDGLIAKGWLRRKKDDKRWDGVEYADITSTGSAIVDIYGPDYGLDTIPEDSDAET